jgi:hypothetical protein
LLAVWSRKARLAVGERLAAALEQQVCRIAAALVAAALVLG